MSIEVACPGCGQRLTAPDQAAGKRARCAGCGASMQIPVAPAAVIIPQVIDGPPRLPSAPAVATTGIGRKLRRALAWGLQRSADGLRRESSADWAACPYCREPIQRGAQKCPHCKEFLHPALRAHELELQLAHPFPHGWHCAISLVTGGLWAPIWVLGYLQFRSDQVARREQLRREAEQAERLFRA